MGFGTFVISTCSYMYDHSFELKYICTFNPIIIEPCKLYTGILPSFVLIISPYDLWYKFCVRWLFCTHYFNITWTPFPDPYPYFLFLLPTHRWFLLHCRFELITEFLHIVSSWIGLPVKLWVWAHEMCAFFCFWVLVFCIRSFFPSTIQLAVHLHSINVSLFPPPSVPLLLSIIWLVLYATVLETISDFSMLSSACLTHYLTVLIRCCVASTVL